MTNAIAELEHIAGVDVEREIAELELEDQRRRAARRAAWRVLGTRVGRRWPAAFQTLGALGLNAAAWLAWGDVAALATLSVSVLIMGVLREAGLI